MDAFIEKLWWYVAFLFSVTAHEAAHAWTARRSGDPTAYHGGQVTLDPIPHILREPVGMVVLPLLCLYAIDWPFGYASAPYDPLWAERYPKRAAGMVLSGPAANLLLAIAAGMVLRLGLAVGWFVMPAKPDIDVVVLAGAPGVWTGVAGVLSIFFTLNLMLATLNMMPLPPFDGHAALPLLLSDRLGQKYRAFVNHPALRWFGLIIAWNVFLPIFAVVFSIARALVYAGAQ